jgi:DNA topoisomerase III
MSSIVICEKPSQGRNLQAALGTAYGPIYACQGHLLRLQEPEDVNPDWKRWTLDTLVPPTGRYGYVEDSYSGKPPRIAAIRKALATASEVIIATDCDREGQGIGQSLLEHFGYRGRVKRAIYNAEDPASLQKAFKALDPNSKHEATYQAFIARQQADQIYNLTLTRVATVALREPFTKGVIGIGRVKTATMGMICKREKEILTFKPVEYFEVKLTVLGPSGTAELTYSPAEDKKILQRTVADEIARIAQTYKGPISVKTERKKKSPPNPMDLPTLQQRANTLWGWTAAKTSSMAQELYEEIKAITYPRAETRYLPEVMIAEVPRLADLVVKIPAYAALPVKAPIIRKGKDGVFSDKQLEGISHHAIIPNINCPAGLASAVARMTKDQALLFDLVARSFLACVGEDYVYDSTTMSVPVAVASVDPKNPLKFAISGSVPVYLGWRAIDDSAPEDVVRLPPLKDGEAVVAQQAEVKASWTKPPNRYSEAAVIKLMQEAWRFCPDPAEQARLKEAKGIGTPATRDTIIDSLKKQNLIVLDRKNLVPTDAGMLIYDVLLECAPSLVDPASTARMEAMLDEILLGKTDADTVIRLITKQADVMSRAIQRSTVKVNLERATSTRKAAAGAAKPAGATTPRAGGGKAGGAKRAASAPAKGASPAGKSAPAGKGAPAAPPRAAAARPVAPPAAAPVDRVWLTVPAEAAAQKQAYGMKARYDAITKRWWVPTGSDLSAYKQQGWV